MCLYSTVQNILPGTWWLRFFQESFIKRFLKALSTFKCYRPNNLNLVLFATVFDKCTSKKIILCLCLEYNWYANKLSLTYRLCLAWIKKLHAFYMLSLWSNKHRLKDLSLNSVHPSDQSVIIYLWLIVKISFKCYLCAETMHRPTV